MLQLEKKTASLKEIDRSKKRKRGFVNNTDKLARLEQVLGFERQLHRFKLEFENMSVQVKVQPSHMKRANIEFMFKMTQFQVNSNDAKTGHKLQG